MGKYIVIFITVSGDKEAKKIAEFLVKTKLAACVNIVPKISSIYRWKGKIERSKELLLVVKTKKAVFKKLIKEVKKIHKYTVPEIISLPITGGNEDYLKWIDNNTIDPLRKAKG